LHVYITDREGHNFEPAIRPADVPLNARLGPGESVQLTRAIETPADIRDPGLVITHSGGIPIGWLIIGYDTWFRKPPMAPLPL